MLANPESPDDWLNEGPGEYTAYQVTSDMFGETFADSLMAGDERDQL